MTEADGYRTVAVIGGGPAGLMAAEILSRNDIKTHLFDAMPSVGRKFLMAGKGGLNLTHSEPFERFLSRYNKHRNVLKPLLEQFGPDELRAWTKTLGIDTFIGSSGRVFPTNMKAAPLLRAWLQRLRNDDVQFHMRHRWLGWDFNRLIKLEFATPDGERNVQCQAVILAVGGASWPSLGATGLWAPLIQEKKIVIAPFQPSNCGFHVLWSQHFRKRFAGMPVKNVTLTVLANNRKFSQTGEFIVSEEGVEGSLVYAASAMLREMILAEGKAVAYLDLCPQLSFESLFARLLKARGKVSLANHLRRQIGIHGVKAGLLHELNLAEDIHCSERLAQAIKALKLELIATQPLTQAISSAGGIAFSELDDKLMIKSLPGVFCAGEMLDWEAPTGGYLLTACFATGRQAGLGVLDWLNSKNCAKP